MKKSTLKILIICSLIVATGISFSVFRYIGVEKLNAYFSAIMFSADFKDQKPLSTKNYDMLDENDDTINSYRLEIKKMADISSAIFFISLQFRPRSLLRRDPRRFSDHPPWLSDPRSQLWTP